MPLAVQRPSVVLDLSFAYVATIAPPCLPIGLGLKFEIRNHLRGRRTKREDSRVIPVFLARSHDVSCQIANSSDLCARVVLVSFDQR